MNGMQAIGPKITGVSAYYLHFVDLSQDLDARQQAILNQLLAYGSPVTGKSEGGIDEDGYLGTSLEDIQSSLTMPELEIDLSDVEAVLHQVQNFDPVGVGARDLRECLLIQLRQYADSTPWRQAAVTLVKDHLDLLAARDYAQLMRLLKLEKEELQL